MRSSKRANSYPRCPDVDHRVAPSQEKAVSAEDILERAISSAMTEPQSGDPSESESVFPLQFVILSELLFSRDKQPVSTNCWNYRRSKFRAYN